MWKVKCGMADGYAKEADLIRAMAHPVRLRILDILAQREACVCHLMAVLGRKQAYISQQLMVLRGAGLVKDRKEGNLVYYRLADERVKAFALLGRQIAQIDRGAPFAPPPDLPVPGCTCPQCAPGNERATAAGAQFERSTTHHSIQGGV